MKIIKSPLTKYNGKIKCDVCGTSFEYDYNDVIKVETQFYNYPEFGSYVDLYVTCPLCTKKFYLDRVDTSKKK